MKFKHSHHFFEWLDGAAWISMTALLYGVFPLTPLTLALVFFDVVFPIHWAMAANFVIIGAVSAFAVSCILVSLGYHYLQHRRTERSVRDESE